MPRTQREFVRDLGISAAAVPFVLNLPSLAFIDQQERKQRNNRLLMTLAHGFGHPVKTVGNPNPCGADVN